MDLNYDLGDKSENLRKINHFEKFNKANRNFFFAENDIIHNIIFKFEYMRYNIG